jgi:hypothetical protein
VVGHDTLPPSPNHGFLVSAEDADTTGAVTLQAPRLIYVYDLDASDFGGGRGYLDRFLERGVIVKERRETRFKGLQATYLRYEHLKQGAITISEEMVMYRANAKNIGPIVYVVALRTSPEHYREDDKLYRRMLEGFQISAVPPGECSND